MRLRRLIPRYTLRTLAVFLLLVTSAGWLWWHWEAWGLELSLSTPDAHRDVYYSMPTPDSTRVILPGDEDDLLIWNLAKGTRELSLPVFRLTMAAAAVSPDNAHFATVDGDGTVQVWNLRTGESVRSWKHGATKPLSSLAFTSEGSKLVLRCTEGEPIGWDARTGLRVPLRETDDVNWRHNALHPQLQSPDGRLAIEVPEPYVELRVVEKATGKMLFAVTDAKMTFDAASFSPDGSKVLTMQGLWSHSEPVIRLRDAETGLVLREFAGRGGPRLRAYHSKDGSRLVVSWIEGRFADAEAASTVDIYRRRRPEWWWGIFWLKEFWLTVFFAGVFAWSVWRDRAALAPPSAGAPHTAGP